MCVCVCVVYVDVPRHICQSLLRPHGTSLRWWWLFDARDLPISFLETLTLYYQVARCFKCVRREKEREKRVSLFLSLEFGASFLFSVEGERRRRRRRGCWSIWNSWHTVRAILSLFSTDSSLLLHLFLTLCVKPKRGGSEFGSQYRKEKKERKKEKKKTQHLSCHISCDATARNVSLDGRLDGRDEAKVRCPTRNLDAVRKDVYRRLIQTYCFLYLFFIVHVYPCCLLFAAAFGLLPLFRGVDSI